jgi:hypothetical protein
VFESLNFVKLTAPYIPIENFEDFETNMKGMIERHLESVPPALGSREELKAAILDGMTGTWRLVSPQFKHNW